MPFEQSCAAAFATGILATMLGLSTLAGAALILVVAGVPYLIHTLRS